MSNPPDEFQCPILMTVMTDPVIGSDGHTYERSAIIAALRRDPRSPINRAPMTIESLKPNFALKSLIERWKTNPVPTARPSAPPAAARPSAPPAIEADHYYAMAVYQEEVSATLASRPVLIPVQSVPKQQTTTTTTTATTPLSNQQKQKIFATVAGVLVVIIILIIILNENT